MISLTEKTEGYTSLSDKDKKPKRRIMIRGGYWDADDNGEGGDISKEPAKRDRYVGTDDSVHPYDRGIIEAQSGTIAVRMFCDQPGVFFDPSGAEVSEDVARAAGLDVDTYSKQRRERDVTARAEAHVEELLEQSKQAMAAKVISDPKTPEALKAKVREIVQADALSQAQAKLESEHIRKVREAGQS